MIGESAPDPDRGQDAGTTPDPPPAQPQPEEFGGRDGPDPTRYGDWEKNGRCIDF
ncbi:DUF1674 domain-containing protein [Luteimonas abyssi]|jgi:hypothetical protein|uniref:DUF1674 domain-containing protein n=1 Tax=Luteimonas abyssi TaxID=1247514 RepID=UPI0009EAB7F8|nr:DUF1674 domain-containing protein [Luteimonas abyssi]